LGHWSWDVKSNQAICSEEYSRIYGQLDCTINYEDFLKAVVPHDRERVDLVIKEALAQKTGYTTEFQIARSNGDLRTVSTVAELLLDQEGMPECLTGTCQDITDVRRAQEESFARQKLESIGTLASGIAHDFNNLVGGVLAQADLAFAELDAHSSPKAELKGIREAAIRGSEIVRQLMIYAGKESAAVELVDVSRVVKEMLALLKVSVSKRAVMKTSLPKGLPAVRANAAQIRQIAMNLVTNASEAIGNRDGVIRVTTEHLSIADAAAASKNPVQGDFVQLEVSDTGCGMSEETKAKAFDPIFHDPNCGPWPWAGGCPWDRARSPWSDPRCQRAGQRDYV
jgi:PAS domain S-box-containing protein